MIAGTTQALLINLGVDLSTVDKVIFTFANHNRDIVLQKVYPGDAQISDGKLYVPLTQADTLCLTGTYNLEMQVNFKGGVVSKTATYQRTISKTLATEIVNGSAPTADTVDVINADVSDGVVFVGSSGGSCAVFVPSVSGDGVLSWTNDAGLDNPSPVNIKGEKGEQGQQGTVGPQGIQGQKGDDGYTPVKGVDYWTTADKAEIVADVLNALPAAEGVAFGG